MSNTEHLKSLGKKVDYAFNYNANLLEKFESDVKNSMLVTLDAFEFSTLCPITSQPDFAKIVISYVPNKYMVESKSLKLYLFSYRNEGNFHEQVVNTILNDLIALLDPNYIEVVGNFNSRGGIAIRPFACYAKEGTQFEGWKEKRMQAFADSVIKLN